MTMSVAVHRKNWRDRYGRRNFRFLFIQREMATAAKIIVGAKLNQQTVVAADNLPCIDGSECSGHFQVWECQSWYSQSQLERNVRHWVCGSQEKSRAKHGISMRKAGSDGEDHEKTGIKP